jgi:hypothetical protein
MEWEVDVADRTAIAAEAVSKRFGRVIALDGIDLESRAEPFWLSSARTERARRR